MEPVPIDKSHEEAVRFSSLEKYCRRCTEANGEAGSALLAVVELLQCRFNLDFEEANNIVTNARLFDSSDSDQVMMEKAAIAPLLLMDMYVESLVTDDAIMQDTPQQRACAREEIETVNNWYSDMVGLACGMSIEHHSVINCCNDDSASTTTRCAATENCPIRIVRTMLLEAIYQPHDVSFYDDSSAAKWQIIMDAKLAVANECEFITDEHKKELELICAERMAQPRGEW